MQLLALNWHREQAITKQRRPKQLVALLHGHRESLYKL
jgi:hypothetical protein